MSDVYSFKTGESDSELQPAGFVDRNKVAIVVGGSIGFAVGVMGNVLLFLLVYIWPWSVLIGCEQ